MDNLPFVVDPQVLADVLTYHWRKGIGGCACGWEKVGHAFTEHQIEVTRAAMVTPDVWVREQSAKDPFSAHFAGRFGD